MVSEGALRRVAAGFFAVFAFVVISDVGVVNADPIQAPKIARKITVQVSRKGGDTSILKQGLKARLQSSSPIWERVPDATVSVPHFDVQLLGLQGQSDISILLERTAKIEPDSSKQYVLRLPVLSKSNSFLITVVDAKGGHEEWVVHIALDMEESVLFVDESCLDFVFKIRELRTSKPNFILLGCVGGTKLGELSLEFLWEDLEKMEYRGQSIVGQSSIITVPLDARSTSNAELIGITRSGGRSEFRIEYEPRRRSAYELSVGLALFRASFEQSNFEAEYRQLSTALFGQILIHPEDVKLSLLLRGFGSVIPISYRLNPAQGYSESVRTFFVDGEIRYRLVDRGGWMVDPFFGGWMFFMNVESRKFGIQRIIDPVMGLAVERRLTQRDRGQFSLRLVPLQTVFNPLNFSKDQSYIEVQAAWFRALRGGSQFFSNFSYGSLNFGTEAGVRTSGSYLVLGGGLSW